MNLNAALAQLGQFLGLSVVDLIEYAAEDDLGGYHFDVRLRKWPSGSLWEAEGQALYAIVRAARPRLVLELGVHVGASTTHLRRAVQQNGVGYVHSVDRWGGAGVLIPDLLYDAGQIHYTDALAYIETYEGAPVDFVFEDLCHESHEVETVIRLLAPKLARNAILIHHDSEHGNEGEEVRHGIEAAGITEYLSLAFGGSDCGLAAYRL